MKLPDDYFMLINTFCKFAHLYILTGYLNYLSDRPAINAAYVTVSTYTYLFTLYTYNKT